jgi:hypothetical protein
MWIVFYQGMFDDVMPDKLIRQWGASIRKLHEITAVSRIFQTEKTKLAYNKLFVCMPSSIMQSNCKIWKITDFAEWSSAIPLYTFRRLTERMQKMPGGDSRTPACIALSTVQYLQVLAAPQRRKQSTRQARSKEQGEGARSKEEKSKWVYEKIQIVNMKRRLQQLHLFSWGWAVIPLRSIHIHRSTIAC